MLTTTNCTCICTNQTLWSFCNCRVNVSAHVLGRKGQLNGCVNSIIMQFSFAHSVRKLPLLTQGYILYGSSLWNL